MESFQNELKSHLICIEKEDIH